jgi:hypothetical protein
MDLHQKINNVTPEVKNILVSRSLSSYLISNSGMVQQLWVSNSLFFSIERMRYSIQKVYGYLLDMKKKKKQKQKQKLNKLACNPYCSCI